MFQNKVVLITGGGHGIGACTATMFQEAGAIVETIDIQNGSFLGDVSRPEDLEAFVQMVIARHGRIDYLINNVPAPMLGIAQCSYEQFQHALSIGISAPFYLTKLCLPYFQPGACIINLSSTRARMSMPQSESYAASKGGVEALTIALAMSLAGSVRVNAIAPGWIDTTQEPLSEEDHLQQPVGRVGRCEDIAHMILYLCSEKASFITGQCFVIDGGMSRQMIYHQEFGWTYTQ